MSRRRNYAPINRNVDGSRSSIGDFYVDEAVKVLDITARTEAALFVTKRFSSREVVPMLFDPDILTRVQNARGLVRPAYSELSYSVWGGIKVGVQYGETNLYLPVEECHVRVQHVLIEPLFEAVKTIHEIFYKYAEVKHMLRWFNRNATPGAVRNYWPAVLSLCPKSPSIEQEAPQRYMTPDGIGDYLPLIRSTATTVATMQMLPTDIEPNKVSSVWLTCEAGTVTRQSVGVNTDQVRFYL